MTNKEKIILQLEEEWLRHLYVFTQDLFAGKNLSSHDHNHHLRVWHFAKNLLVQVYKDKEIESSFVLDLMFASFFHDTGLTRTLDIKHGLESLHILEENLELFPGIVVSEPLQKAIVYHDDKNFRVPSKSVEYSVPVLLATADDLDAFGTIGAFRYTEIYFLRGIPTNELAATVVKNLHNRFRNFTNRFANFTDLQKVNKHRYQITEHIFTNASSDFLNILKRMLIDEKCTIYDLLKLNDHENKELRNFVMNIKTEWATFEKIISQHEN